MGYDPHGRVDLKVTLVLLAACGKPAPPPAPCPPPPAHHGQATYYVDSTNACGFAKVNDPRYAAVSAADWNKGAWCGTCLQVADATGHHVIVHVVDVYPACKTGDLDLATPAFAQLAPLDRGRIPITWAQVSCAPLLFDVRCP